MNCLIRSITVVVVLLGALVVAPAPSAVAGEMGAKFKIGDSAPDFSLQDIDGRTVRLSSVNKDKVVLLAFWSLRCGACLQEVPFLTQLHNSYNGKGVAVLSVVTDGVDATATKTIMQDVGVAPNYPVLVDPDFAVSDIYTNFVVPHTLVIDRKGVIRYLHTGFEQGTEKRYEAALNQALGS